MNLKRNRGDITGYVFLYVCQGCGSQKASTWPYWADLDGEPFKAYYCDHCGSAKSILHARTKGADHHDHHAN